MAITDFFIHVDTLMDYEYSIYKVEVQEVCDQIKALYRRVLSDVKEITAFRVLQHYAKKLRKIVIKKLPEMTIFSRIFHLSLHQ